MIKIENLNMQVGNHYVKSTLPLEFSNGNMYFIKGPSGCGKTTLLYILGLISSQTRYQYYFQTRLLETRKERDFVKKKAIGFIYQNFNFTESEDVFHQLSFFAGLSGIKLSKEDAFNLLDKVHLNIDLNQSIPTLSGGEKQRLCLACVIAKNPQVIIADEPTSALDSKNASQMMEILKYLAVEENKTVIVTTHTSQFDNLADEIYEIGDNFISPVKKKNKIHEENVQYTISKYKDHLNIDLLKHYFLNTLEKYKGIYLLCMMIVSLTVILMTCVNQSQIEYHELLKNMIQNEVVLTDKLAGIDYNPSLIEELENTAQVITIHPIYHYSGSVVLNNQTRIEDVSIIPLYPFQGNKVLVSSFLFEQMGHEIEIEYGDKLEKITVDEVVDNSKSSLYGVNEKCIMVPVDLLTGIHGSFTGKYILEIDNFANYEYIKERIERMNDGYSVENGYQNIYLLLQNLEMNKFFVYLTIVIMELIILIVMIVNRIHEVKDRQKRMSLLQANGLTQKDIIKMEIIVFIGYFLIFFIGNYFLSIGIIPLINHTLIAHYKLTVDKTYMINLIISLGINLFVPVIISTIMQLRFNLEKELRANISM